MVAMTPEDEALLAQIMFSGGLGQMQAPAPGAGALHPQPDLLPPGQMMPARMPMPEQGALYPPNMEGVTVKGGAPAMPYGGPDLPPLARGTPTPPTMPQSAPLDLGALAAAGAPQTAIATNDTPMAPSPMGGVSPAQPAGAGQALGGLFADKEEIMARIGDMMSGWAMGAGGTWQDSLAAGGKAVQIGKLTRKEKKELAASDNKTREWAISQGVDPSTADAYVQAGQGKALINLVEDYKKQAAEAAKPQYQEVAGRIVDMRDPTKVVADFRDGKGEVATNAAERAALAAQYGMSPDDPRFQSFILTGKFPREDAQPLTATDKKAILEADEMVSAAQGAIPLIDRAMELNSKAYAGPFAGTRGYLGSFVGAEGANETVELDNVITEQALSQMKAIFGGNPTEGERAILLEIAGASSMPPDVRQKVFERAKAAVERRLNLYSTRASELRGGDFYKAGGGAPGQPASAPQQQPSAQPQRRRYNPATGELE